MPQPELISPPDPPRHRRHKLILRLHPQLRERGLIQAEGLPQGGPQIPRASDLKGPEAKPLSNLQIVHIPEPGRKISQLGAMGEGSLGPDPAKTGIIEQDDIIIPPNPAQGLQLPGDEPARARARLMCTGPGLPEVASLNALLTTWGTSDASVTVMDSLVTPWYKAVWSIPVSMFLFS